jgi:hypothetical protein
MRRLIVMFLLATLILPLLPAPAAQAAPATPAASTPNAPLPLSAYPRPPQDNGLGLHWGTSIYGQPPEVVDYFVGELVAMNVRWVKFLNDGTEGRHNEYLIQQLVAHGIMPVMRIYQRCNRNLDIASLRRLVAHYVPMGVYYYEVYNEPELNGVDGGWCDGEKPDPDWLIDHWVSAARAIEEGGGYPGLPSMFPPSTTDAKLHDSFFMRFFEGLKQRGATDVLYRSWGAVHNYFLNHPVDYPYDDVNLTGRPLTNAEITQYKLTPGDAAAINDARARDRLPRDQGGFHVGDTADEDPNCFLMFQAYRDRFYDIFGFEIPLISTEGGAQVGSSEDRRYPKVDADMQAQRTLQAAQYMLNKAPAYYFAFTTWLIADNALGRGGSTWESWAWFQNRAGDHLPVVDLLKAQPKRVRGAAMPGTATPTPIRTPAVPAANPDSLTSAPAAAPAAASQSAPASPAFSRFPRPANDNGWGIHWTPTLFAQPTDVVDHWVDEAAGMGIRWVKLMQQDQAKVEHEDLIRALVNQGMMPILRVYRPYNTPYEHLGELVAAAKKLGVCYFELYNEPNVAGFPGGWHDGEAISPERMADLWLPAARTVIAAGGLPSVPAPAPGGDYDDVAFLRAFLRRVVAQGGQDVLPSSWLALHNYFLNHPLDYPQDPVNVNSVPLTADEISRRGLSADQVQSINDARANSHQPRSQGGYWVGNTIDADSNGFRKFEVYESVAKAETGLDMPVLSTEGGAMPGSQEDPRYPAVTDQDVADMTAAAYRYITEQAPAYYFTFTPWIIANQAAGGRDGQWENAAWFQGYNGTPKPVVDAVRTLAKTGATRQNLNTTTSPAQATPTPAAPTTASGGLTPANIVQPSALTGSAIRTGWLVVWREAQLFRCVPATFVFGQAILGEFDPPQDGARWGLDVRDASGARVRSFGVVPHSDGQVPWLCLDQNSPAPPAPTPTPTPDTSWWDKRLDILKVGLTRGAPATAATPYWKLVKASFEDEKEAGGRHHIYVRLLDKAGHDVAGTVTVSWPDGAQPMSGPAYDPTNPDPHARYGINFPMYGLIGNYRVAVTGVDGQVVASDTVTGMGLPGKRHVNFLLTFQLQ